MALFLFYSRGSSFSSCLNILALIILVLVCFCSYCSSSSPIINVDSPIDDIDMYDIQDDITYTPLKLSSYHHRNVFGQAIFPSKNRFINILLKPALIQPDYRYKTHNDKRYTAQGFHAMRG